VNAAHVSSMATALRRPMAPPVVRDVAQQVIALPFHRLIKSSYTLLLAFQRRPLKQRLVIDPPLMGIRPSE